MLNEIIKGIATALHTEFGNGYEIYQNDVEQGLQEPCFFIAVLKPDLTRLPSGRYLATNPFDIHYFPRSMGDNTELCTAAERMEECLEFITLPSGVMLHGTGMSYQIVDDVLHLFINFDCIVTRSKTNDPMETITIETDVKTMGGMEWQLEEE